jgi:hypothetical protein
MEKIIDAIHNLIYEMVIEKKHIENQISDKSEQIILHLIKILKWDDSNSYTGHIKSINGWFHFCQKKKINKHRISAKHYQAWLFDEELENIQDLNNIVEYNLEEYDKLPVIRTNQEIFDIIQKIKLLICEDLSKFKFKTIENYI